MNEVAIYSREKYLELNLNKPVKYKEAIFIAVPNSKSYLFMH